MSRSLAVSGRMTVTLASPAARHHAAPVGHRRFDTEQKKTLDVLIAAGTLRQSSGTGPVNSALVGVRRRRRMAGGRPGWVRAGAEAARLRTSCRRRWRAPLVLLVIALLRSLAAPPAADGLTSGQVSFTQITPFAPLDSNNCSNAGPRAMFL